MKERERRHKHYFVQTFDCPDYWVNKRSTCSHAYMKAHMTRTFYFCTRSLGFPFFMKMDYHYFWKHPLSFRLLISTEYGHKRWPEKCGSPHSPSLRSSILPSSTLAAVSTIFVRGKGEEKRGPLFLRETNFPFLSLLLCYGPSRITHEWVSILGQRRRVGGPTNGGCTTTNVCPTIMKEWYG